MRIFFTGGSGKAGRHAIAHLVELGHRVTNADLVPAGIPQVPDLRVDLTDAGQVFNALSAYARFGELEAGTGVPSYDAVVHFAAIPAILVRPDNETFRINAMSTYNVIDAAVKLGVPSDEVYERFYAGVPRRRPMGEYETFYSNDKAKRLVGFAPRHAWRDAKVAQ